MAVTDTNTDVLTIAGKTLRSRLLLGTGGFRSLETLATAIEVSGTELVTVALRRIDPSSRGSLVDVLDRAGVQHVDQRPARRRIDPPQRDRDHLGLRLLDRLRERLQPREPAGPEDQPR